MHVSVFLVSLFLSYISFAKPTFPIHPAHELTPGSFCQHPDEFRYPEKIPYCERDVSTETKIEVIKEYELRFGYDILSHRMDFKVDHFIPLCMGGSNNRDNLWPQHKSVYEITDPFEQELCQKLAAGKITQSEAAATIREIKLSLQ